MGGVPSQRAKPRPKAKDSPNLELLPQGPRPSPRLVLMTMGKWEASWSFLGQGRGTSKCPRQCLTLHEREHESWSTSQLVKGEGWLVKVTWHKGLKALPLQGQVMTKAITTDHAPYHGCLEVVFEAIEKVRLIRDRLKTAQSRQKSCANNRKKDVEFKVGDWVYLKISSMKGVMRFGKKGKLVPGDPVSILPLEGLGVDENLSYEEVPVEILDWQAKKLRNKEVASVKPTSQRDLHEGLHEPWSLSWAWRQWLSHPPSTTNFQGMNKATPMSRKVVRVEEKIWGSLNKSTASPSQVAPRGVLNTTNHEGSCGMVCSDLENLGSLGPFPLALSVMPLALGHFQDSNFDV
ncbi:hypothetical protein MTR67_043354 [Solanum verrucosum]|uniref:Uncharacterized protein n=1 Tax=Solanum verrucosum TaxID=315347 RepID=A0AAF0ZV26_SOLVR|nr:hypothetical protein MTR67_043354 [Solanum verrucosum]